MIRIEIDYREVRQALENLQRRVSDLTPVMHDIGQALVEGMAAAWDLPMADGGLLRMASTRTQTRKGRMARWGNVKEAFQIDAPEKLEGKHILLVDDVVTTGSTLEGCVLALQAVPGVRVSVMACACA